MAPEVRRQAIIDATLPLLLAQGTEVSTREIASAAGVAEGTIFRVFETKQELIHATIHAALAPDAAMARLTGLPASQPVEARVAAVVEILRSEIERTRSLFAHLFHPASTSATGPDTLRRAQGSLAEAPGSSGRAQGSSDGHRPPWPPPPPMHAKDSRAQLTAAVAAALEPYADQFAVPTVFAAQVLSALSFATSFSLSNDHPLRQPEELADTVLHGIARRG